MNLALVLAPPPASQLLGRIAVARRIETPDGPGAFRIDSTTIVLRDLHGGEPAGVLRSTWHRTPTSGAGGGVARCRSCAVEPPSALPHRQ